MIFQKKYLLLLVFLFLFAYMFFSTYNEVKEKTIEEFNIQQMLFARQAALGIETFFTQRLRELSFISGIDSIIDLDDQGKDLMRAYFKNNADTIKGITRVDAAGRILHTFPVVPQAIGADISHQTHVRQILDLRQPVVSDIFMTLQGYEAVAYHVPVFKDTTFKGTLAVLIPFNTIAERYIERIKIGQAGYAWVISQNGVEISCPVPGHVGKTVFETSAQFPSVITMAKKMTAGEHGTGTYTYDMVRDEKIATITKHAAYYPITLGNTFWSIVVATPEDDVITTMTGFRNRLFSMVALLIFVGSVYYYFIFKAWAIIGEEKKRKKAESALQQSEKKYRDLVELGGSIILRWNTAGNIIFMNSYGLDFFGYGIEELAGSNVVGTIVPETESDTQRDLACLMKDIQNDPEKFRNIENENMKKDQTRVWISWSNKAIFNEGGDLVEILSIGNDITEIKMLETRLQRAHKMEALGTLAGGVAHDLNNILGGIVSYPDLLLLDLPENSPLRKPILTIRESGEKAATIVQDLLTLARRGIAITEVANLNLIIADYLKSPEHDKLISHHLNARFKTHLDPHLLNMICSPVHLSKSIMNLVSNAVESMPDGGTVVITTENRYLDSPISGYEEVEAGDYAVLTVSDTGIGLSPDEIPKIFEPFYTKKVLGFSGTGLGMSVVWGTVKDHKGYIRVESAAGNGTTFTLFFPVTRKEMETGKPLPSIDRYMGNGEQILVVDDVGGQREIATDILEKLGYRVISVASGEEAVAYLQRHPVDLVIVDMIMDPGMDGLETYREILKIKPRQKAIIASGFSETSRVKETQKLGAGGYIKKPYTIDILGSFVKKELEKS